MGGFFQKALIYVLALSIGTLSVGFGLSFYAAGFTSEVRDFELDSAMEKSLYNAICPICAIFGGIFVNMAMKRYGRKWPCLAASVVVIIAYILIACTETSYRVLAFIGRGICGLGVGAVSTVTPVYIAEISPTDQRGAYGVMSQLATSFGSLIMYGLGIWLEWRWLAIVAIVPPAVLVAAIFFTPESPATARLNEGQTESLFQKKFIKRIGISLLVVIFQQFSGINALMTNLNPIFHRSNVNLKPAVASVIVCVGKVCTTTLATPMVEKLGRRWTWMISSIGQAVFLLILWANEVWSWSDIIPIVMLFFDLLVFGLGLGPIPWFVVPELFPDSLRSIAMSSIQAVNWGLAALNVFVFESMQEAMTLGWVYFFYGVIMVLSFLFGWFILPETRGVEMGADEKVPSDDGAGKLSSERTKFEDAL